MSQLVSSAFINLDSGRLFVGKHGFESIPRTRFARVFFEISTGLPLHRFDQRSNGLGLTAGRNDEILARGNLAKKCKWMAWAKLVMPTPPFDLVLNNRYCCGFACDCKSLQYTETTPYEQLQSFHMLLMSTLLLF